MKLQDITPDQVPGISGMYYSCCFSVCDCTTAQRGSWLGCGGYMVSPPFVRGRHAAWAARRVL